LNKILPNSKIGTISNYDPNKYENFVLDEYVNEPIRKTDALKYHTTRPCNAETKQVNKYIVLFFSFIYH
jgi:hypothetical protein